MVASNNVARKLACLPLAVVLGVLAGCGNDPSTPTAPTAQFGSVTGLLRGEAPMLGRIPRPHPALSNATVTVVGGPASGTKSTTGADGTYQLTAAGTFKLRFEHPSFVTPPALPEAALDETRLARCKTLYPDDTILTNIDDPDD